MENDVLIIGSGPAGIQAAIHAARKKMEVVVLGKIENSSLSKTHIHNYFGVRKDGASLLKIGKAQAEDFGAVFYDEDVLMIEPKNDDFLVKTDEGRKISAKVLILAIGAHRKKLDVENEEKFLGKGLSYCAECDCTFFKNKDVAIIGNESSAASSALLLMKYANNVYLITKELKIGKRLREELNESDVKIYESRSVKKIYGNEVVEGIILDNDMNIKTQGVFVELGAKGSVELAIPLGILPDANGYISVNSDMETNMKGVYACGDVTGPPLQLAKAVGEGCIAGTKAAEYVKSK